MRRFLFFLISFFIGVVLFFLVVRTIGYQEIKDALLSFRAGPAIIILVLTALAIFIENWKWQMILRGAKVNLSFGALWKIYIASYGLKYFAPMMFMSGEFMKGYFLKKNHSVSWSRGIPSVIIDRILSWTVNFVVIIFGLAFFLLKIAFPPKNIAIILGGSFVVLCAGLIFFYLKILRKKSIVTTIFKIFAFKKGFFGLQNGQLFFQLEKEIFGFFNFQKSFVWKGFGITFLRTGVLILRTWLLVNFLGKGIAFLPSISLLSFTFLITIIPIPTALGSHELVQTFAFKTLGLAGGTAAAFTMILRASEVILALIGIVALLGLGLTSLKNLLLEKVETLVSRDQD